MSENDKETDILDKIADKISKKTYTNGVLYDLAFESMDYIRELYLENGYKHVLENRDYRDGFLGRLLYTYSE